MLSKTEVLKCLLGNNNEYVVRKCTKAGNDILSKRKQLLYKSLFLFPLNQLFLVIYSFYDIVNLYLNIVIIIYHCFSGSNVIIVSLWINDDLPLYWCDIFICYYVSVLDWDINKLIKTLKPTFGLDIDLGLATLVPDKWPKLIDDICDAMAKSERWW